MNLLMSETSDWLLESEKESGPWGCWRLPEMQWVTLAFDFSRSKMAKNDRGWNCLDCRVQLRQDEDFQPARLEFWAIPVFREYFKDRNIRGDTALLVIDIRRTKDGGRNRINIRPPQTVNTNIAAHEGWL